MIVNRLKLMLYLIVSLFSNALLAQNTRYIDAVFSDVDISTVNYSDVFSDAAHKMDLYQPKNDTATNRPVIFYIHGGAFYAGDKATQDCIDFCTHFAKKGYVAVSVNYRLANAFLFLINQDVQLEAVLKSMADVKSAIRFFGKDVKTSNNFKIDTNSVFIGGYSAGGVCALHTAWVDSESEIDTKLLQVLKNSIKTLDGDAGNVGYACNIKALFSMAGAIYKTSYASENDQPAWLGHATNDGTVSYNCAPALNNPMVLTLCGTGKIYPKLDSVGINYDTMILSKGDHAWPGLGNKGQDFLNAVEEIAEFFYPMLPSKTPNSAKRFTKQNTVKLYPNPSCEETVNLTVREGKIDKVYLVDVLGRLILPKVIINSDTETLIPVTDLPAGLYKVVVALADGQQLMQNFQKL
jgi:para-nitrobenzyl esterase